MNNGGRKNGRKINRSKYREKSNAQNRKKEENKMAVLAKPSRNLVVVDAKSSRDFIERFNKNTITPKMLESCAKASRLFNHHGKKS